MTQLQVSRRIDRYDSGSTLTSRVSTLAGYRFKRGDFEVKLLVGPQFQNIDPTAPNASLRGPQLGAHGVIETLVGADAVATGGSSWTAYSVSNGRGGRIAAGVRLFDGFWTGPEASAFSDIYSTQYRVGMHITGWHWHDLEWSASAGYLEDNYHRRGGYLRLGVLLRHSTVPQPHPDQSQRAAEARHRDGHRHQHQHHQRDRVVAQILQRRRPSA
ncbi:MAG: cellulose biosynthesis protein BcsS [Rhodopseudomonas palustris]|nr:cellulose biosynthesis protein BcsS [Rhodopseudomonas palustris]